MNRKLFLGVLIGAVAVVAILCLVVAIACSINGLSFGEQIVQWFGNSAPAIGETTEQVVETIVQNPIA